VVKEDEDEDYRPYDTLKAIGFSKDDAKRLLSNIEAAADTQLPPEPRKAPDLELKYQTQKALRRRTRFRYMLLIACGYALAVWAYVIGVQFTHPDWIYAPFATWLPIRMDYVGDAAFIASLAIIIILMMWKTKHETRPEQRHTDADASPVTRRT
jgi:hypothetical protein